MLNVTPAPDDQRTPSFPGWATLVGVFVLYTLSVAVTAFPATWNFRSAIIGGGGDPMHVLWAMRWYKSCLLEGRSPLLCPDIQFPIGAPLAFFDPVRLQTLLYLPLSFLISNDAICYNILFFLAYISTGLSTFVLAWYVVRSRASACLAGLLAMFSTPMLSHAGHLVLIQVAGFPLFLVAWVRFVDSPGWRRLFAVVALYLLLVMSAHYFVVMCVFPACFYVVWRGLDGGVASLWSWFRARAGWFAAFVLLVSPCLLLLFATHLWVIAQGHTMERSRAEFDAYGVPIWGYLVPLPWHRISQVLPFDTLPPWRIPGAGERASYLGVVTLGLMTYAAVSRARFARASFWWSVFALLVVLSLGSFLTIGGYKISLPDRWLHKYFFAFRYLRVPARFNLFTSVGAAVLAAAGLKHLLDRLPRPWMKTVLFGVLFLTAYFDLTPPAGQFFRTTEIPPMPACYAELTKRDPNAAFLDVPMLSSGSGSRLTAASAYWQTLHRGKTSGGYGAHANAEFDAMIVDASPFALYRLNDPQYLKSAHAEFFPFVAGVRFEDYLWLYLTVHRFDYVVLHRRDYVPEFQLYYARLKALLAPAQVFADRDAIVFARARLAPPKQPVALCTKGWLNKATWKNQFTCLVDKPTYLTLYNPDPGRAMTIALVAAGREAPRTVRILNGTMELARWEVRPGDLSAYQSPPLRLPAGLVELTLVSEANRAKGTTQAEPPSARRQPQAGLRVGAVLLNPLPQDPEVASQPLRSAPERVVR